MCVHFILGLLSHHGPCGGDPAEWQHVQSPGLSLLARLYVAPEMKALLGLKVLLLPPLPHSMPVSCA